MGIFKKGSNQGNDIYMEEVKPYLLDKDGFTHVVMLNMITKYSPKDLRCDVEYTREVNTVLTNMQTDGYEIINVVTNSSSSLTPSPTTMAITFNTLITYK